jgi:hypothetical protein
VDRTENLTGRWIARTFAGWSAGFVLAILLIVVAESIGLRDVQFPLALGMGAGVGLFQSRLTGLHFGVRRRWILATAAGLTLPFLLSDILRMAGRPLPYSLAGFVALGGLLTALLQWPLLRRALGRAAAAWVPVTTAGWMSAGSTVWLNEHVLPKTPGLLGALQYIAVVLAGGLILGAAGAVLLHAALPATAEVSGVVQQ